MFELTIVKQNGGAYIDSREVAEVIGKQHGHLMRDIAGYVKTMGKITQSNFGVSDFFLESSYFDRTGRKLPCYLLSKMACELVANKLTGEKGIMFTVAYVSQFNKMETAEREREISSSGKSRLCDFNNAVKNVLNGMSQANTSPANVMKFLHSVYEPLGIKVCENGYTPCFYSPTYIAEYLGIYSETGRPHGRAISAIISKINIRVSQVLVVPYGLVGMAFRYDIDVISAVAYWIIENGYPHEVSCHGFDYHIYYDYAETTLSADDFGDEFIGDAPYDYTAEELDAMCEKFDDCDDCPGFSTCTEVY